MVAASVDAALKQAVGVTEVEGGLWLFEQTASPNKCGHSSTAAVTEVVGGRGENGGGGGKKKRWSTVSARPLTFLTLPFQHRRV